MKLDMLLRSTYKFVAMTDHSDDFVGCVSAETIANDRVVHSYFPHFEFPATTIVLYNLCVSHEFRGHGAGRMLVQAVVDSADSPEHVFLLVSRLNPDEKNPERVAIYNDRIQRLVRTYDKLGFDVVCDCRECHLLKHR